MAQTNQPDWYDGTGTATLAQRGHAAPKYAPFAGEEKPENYIASEGLKNAVNVALYLGQPLLLTGEPGTGKTRLAASVAWELGLPLLEFHTKTTSTACFTIMTRSSGSKTPTTAKHGNGNWNPMSPARRWARPSC